MKSRSLILVLLLSATLSAAAALYIGASFPKETQLSGRAIESRLEQVKRKGVLRCGYVVFPPFITKDPNTGKMGGPSYEVVEELGRQLKLNIVWVAEVSPGQMLADLALNRFDVICSPILETPGRARESDFTRPLVYLPVYLYVREGDNRFDDNYFRANQPDVKFATLDGQYSSIAAYEDFPAAEKVSLPQLSNSVDLFMMVAAKKADLVIFDPYTFADYAARNPNLLRPVRGKALRTVAMGYPVPANEPAFKAMINTTLAYLHDSGFIDKRLKKYDDPVKFIRVSKPYAE